MRMSIGVTTAIVLCVGGSACGSGGGSDGTTGPTFDSVVGVWQVTEPTPVGDGDEAREYYGPDGTSISYSRPSASKGGIAGCFTRRYTIEGDEIVVENKPLALRTKFVLENNASGLRLGAPPNQRRLRRVDSRTSDVTCKTIALAQGGSGTGGAVTATSIVGVWAIDGAPVGLDHVYGPGRDSVQTREFFSSDGVRIVASRDPQPLGSRTCAKGRYSVEGSTLVLDQSSLTIRYPFAIEQGGGVLAITKDDGTVRRYTRADSRGSDIDCANMFDVP